MTRLNPNTKGVARVHLVEEFTVAPNRVSVSGMKVDHLKEAEGKIR
jgi:hypothetical protein